MRFPQEFPKTFYLLRQPLSLDQRLVGEIWGENLETLLVKRKCFSDRHTYRNKS